MKKVEFLYLSQEDIISLNIPWNKIIECVETALKEHAQKTVENPPKPGIHTRPEQSTFIHAMPVHLQQMDAVGIKWVSGYPENYKHDLPQILGLQIMNSPVTGVPLAVMDCRWITAVRTAAVTAITAKHCAVQGSKTFAVIGGGVQGKMHLRALKYVFPSIQECRVFDIREEVTKSFIAKLNGENGVEVKAAKSVKEAVEGADIVLTATQKLAKPIVDAQWIKAGCFGAGLESSRAWDSKMLLGADKFITDDWNQTLHFHQQGAFPDGMPDLYAELGQIIVGDKPGRENAEEKIIAINIGMACEDISLGQYVYELAKERGIGTILPLMKEDF